MIRNILLVLSLGLNIFMFYLMYNLIDGYNPDCNGCTESSYSQVHQPKELRL